MLSREGLETLEKASEGHAGKVFREASRR